MEFFINFAEFAAWENVRRKINILIFVIWNMCVLKTDGDKLSS